MLGSYWNKWDLHVHTPKSIEQDYGGDNEDSWEEYIKDLENLPTEFKVLGINDYLFIDGYEQVLKYKKSGRLKNIELIIPVIELRVKRFANLVEGENWKRVNLHVIFSNDIAPNVIKAQFIDAIQTCYHLSADKKQFWGGVTNRESLIDFGNKIIENSNGKIAGSPLRVGFNNLNFNDDEVFEKLNSCHLFNNKFLIGIGKTEWEALRWTGSAADKKDLINFADLIFIASQDIESFTSAKSKLKEQGVKDLLIDCSDAHTFSKNKTIKDRIGNCFSWIKADLCFEGLKQIIYEPTARLQINVNKPREPIRKIESVTFNFHGSTCIRRKNSLENQPFCISKLTHLIFFNPYFTCLIGGRGTGKSTIINLIAEKLGERTDFFISNELLVQGKVYDVKTDIHNFIHVQGANEIEFVSQGKVEKLTEGQALTQLVFNERILQSNSELQALENQFKKITSLINNQITAIKSLEELAAQRKDKEARKAVYENIIASINDPRYNEISTNINNQTQQISEIEVSKNKYQQLLDELKRLIHQYANDQVSNNEYDVRVSEIINSISNLEEFNKVDDEINVVYKNFEYTDNLKKVAEEELAKQKVSLQNFFISKGTNEENIRDSENANVNLAHLQNEIFLLDTKENNLKSVMQEALTTINTSKEIYDKSKKIIEGAIQELNSKLSISNENVAKIKYVHMFSEQLFKTGLHKALLEMFQTRYHESNVSWDNVIDIIFSVQPSDEILTMDYETFYKKIEKAIEDNRVNHTLYSKVAKSIFNNQFNFLIYQQLIYKHLYDVFEYAKIQGYYGDRLLENCSFGQKCTAVIVTLLMTGVKPLVIDEPEAHLDNKLIADYLIDLIKEKKPDRQIIFATHNANFVVNGDAELIHILEIPEGENFTEITSTTIEDTINREKLLKLEGGRIAFEKREQKLLQKR